MSWRLINTVAILAAVSVGIAVLLLKNEVHERRANVEDLRTEIAARQNSIRVLKAEWALLASPDLLQQRSMRYLALMPVDAEQIIDDLAAIPFRRRGEDAAEDEGVLLPARYRQNQTRKSRSQAEEAS